MSPSSQDRPTHARLRALTIVVAAVVALSAGFAVVVHAADPRLDEAEQALQKAEALLKAAQAGVPSPKVQKEFDREVGRAVELVNRARAHIQAAKTAVDNEIQSSADPAPDQGTGEVAP